MSDKTLAKIICGVISAIPVGLLFSLLWTIMDKVKVTESVKTLCCITMFVFWAWFYDSAWRKLGLDEDDKN
jgi:hypothetical protein